MKKKQSIRTKLMSTTLLLLFLFALIMGMASILIVSRLSQNDSTIIMQQICDEETLKFNNKLSLVEHSVNLIYEYCVQLRKMNDEPDYIYSDEYLNRVCDLSVSVAEQTEGAIAVYFRYNPEMTGNGTDGFFWVKSEDSSKFKMEQTTDILTYNSSDFEHVGWFYGPKESGKAQWLTPYYNKNLDVFMISYIIPVYLDNGNFVGVIGIDIDFNSIIIKENDIGLYETGKIGLVDMSEHLVYYADENENAKKDNLSTDLYNHITTINRSDSLLKYTERDGSQTVICCNRLINNMKLFVSVPQKDINSYRNSLIRACILITMLILLFTAFIIWRNTKRIIMPINKLAQITSQYAKGDWSESYISNTSDEIHELSECIATMASTTQHYINDIRDMARTDGLTGLNNKDYYLEYIEELKGKETTQIMPYAVMVMDLNMLKKTNDSYGHEAGDCLIFEAGKYISRIYTNSKIFRIGGDEYVVILYGDDYENRESLYEQFGMNMNFEVEGTNGTKLSIAYGMSVYDVDSKKYDELFKIADDRMYEMKKKTKKNL